MTLHPYPTVDRRIFFARRNAQLGLQLVDPDVEEARIREDYAQRGTHGIKPLPATKKGGDGK